ncbi:hypothetical protein THAOC_21526, partial [Thalassiosira oceanica]
GLGEEVRVLGRGQGAYHDALRAKARSAEEAPEDGSGQDAAREVDPPVRLRPRRPLDLLGRRKPRPSDESALREPPDADVDGPGAEPPRLLQGKVPDGGRQDAHEGTEQVQLRDEYRRVREAQRLDEAGDQQREERERRGDAHAKRTDRLDPLGVGEESLRLGRALYRVRRDLLPVRHGDASYVLGPDGDRRSEGGGGRGECLGHRRAGEGDGTESRGDDGADERGELGDRQLWLEGREVVEHGHVPLERGEGRRHRVLLLAALPFHGGLPGGGGGGPAADLAPPRVEVGRVGDLPPDRPEPVALPLDQTGTGAPSLPASPRGVPAGARGGPPRTVERLVEGVGVAEAGQGGKGLDGREGPMADLVDRRPPGGGLWRRCRRRGAAVYHLLRRVGTRRPVRGRRPVQGRRPGRVAVDLHLQELLGERHPWRAPGRRGAVPSNRHGRAHERDAAPARGDGPDEAEGRPCGGGAASSPRPPSESSPLRGVRPGDFRISKVAVGFQVDPGCRRGARHATRRRRGPHGACTPKDPPKRTPVWSAVSKLRGGGEIRSGERAAPPDPSDELQWAGLLHLLLSRQPGFLLVSSSGPGSDELYFVARVPLPTRDPQQRQWVEIEVARSAHQVAHSKALGLGITERASGRPGKVREACFRRKFATRLRRRVPFIGKTRPSAYLESCRSSEWDEK